MSVAVETPGTEGQPEGTEGAPQFTAEELASIEKGRSGLSEAPAPAASATQRPANVPEKFWKDGKVDTDALLASYTSLETKLGQPTPPAAAPAEGAPATDANGKIVKPAGEEAANPLTALLETARTDFTSSQAFSEDTAKSLADAGIPVEIQQVYLAGLTALTNQNVETIHGFVGGEKNYAAMSAWAAEKLTDEELDAFNGSLDNPQLRENAVRGLFARFQSARPSEGQQIIPANAGASAGDVFKSRDELVAAQKDPRYQTDAAYRDSVVEKLARSQAVGFRVTPQRMFEGVYRHNH